MFSLFKSEGVEKVSSFEYFRRLTGYPPEQKKKTPLKDIDHTSLEWNHQLVTATIMVVMVLVLWGFQTLVMGDWMSQYPKAQVITCFSGWIVWYVVTTQIWKYRIKKWHDLLRTNHRIRIMGD